jgi:hypothetical protein
VQKNSTTSWFKQFWPWFLIALPMAAVIASIYTVMVAFDNKDSLVKSDYYKEGLAINVQLQQEQLAKQLALGAEIRFNEQDVHLDLHGNADFVWPASLNLQLIHPVNDKMDFTIPLVHLGEGKYQGSHQQQLQHRWHLQLSPLLTSPQDSWLLQSEIHFGSSQTSRFSAQ